MQFYVPQPEEDIYELVMFMTVVQAHSVGDYFQIICALVLIAAGGEERSCRINEIPREL